MLLAIDTSTSLIGAACLDHDELLSEVCLEDSRRHGELLASVIDEALRESGRSGAALSRVVVGVGPGPFTGLRVGITTATVLAYVYGIPVGGVCSLDALAARAMATGGIDPVRTPEFLVATDARRREVYWARYAVAEGRAHRIGTPAVGAPASLPADIRGLPALGRGPLRYPEVLTSAGGETDVWPSSLGRVAGAMGALLPPEPLYLRRPDATAAAPDPAVTG